MNKQKIYWRYLGEKQWFEAEYIYLGDGLVKIYSNGYPDFHGTIYSQKELEIIERKDNQTHV